MNSTGKIIARTMRRGFNVLVLFLTISFTPGIATAQVDNNEQERMKENPTERERFRRRQRADEHGEIAFDALVKAKAQMDLRRAKGNNRIPDDAGIWDWEWLGPGNIGGRIRTILIHPTNPSVIWIGSVSGGIWRSDDAGASWAPVDDFMANLAVTTIVMDPTDANIMYASTGEGFGNADGLQGAGIFKSVNGGVTWSQLASTNNFSFRWVNRLAHHPSLTNILLAATYNRTIDDDGNPTTVGKIWRTSDGGVSWNETLVDTFGTQATDVKFNPTDGNVAMAGTSRNLFLSTDAGMTWTVQTNGAAGKLPGNSGRCEVAFTKANGSFLYALLNRNQGEIWRSTDGGLSWTKMYSTTSGETILGTQGWYANVIAVSPVDQNFVIAGGLDIWTSTQGGASPTRISYWQCFPNCGGSISHSAHADQHAIVFDPGFDGSSNRKVYVGNDGGIQMASDIAGVGGPLGNGWTNLNNDLGITQFYGGAAAADGNVIVGGAQDNADPEYDPAHGVNAWSNNSALGDGGYCAIDYTNAQVRYAEYVYLRILQRDGVHGYRDAYGGISDVCLDPTLGCGTANFIAPFSLDPNDHSTLVAGGISIWNTNNGAGAWGRIRNPITGNSKCSAIDIAKGNSSVIWVGYNDGTVSFTTDNGTSWTDVDKTTPGWPTPPRLVTDIAINPTDANEVFVTFGGYQPNNIWLTTNSGASWTLRQGTGLKSVPALQVNTIRYHPANTNWVYVGTDLGVFASEDKGVTWETTPRFGKNDGPVNVEVDELFWQGDEYLIAATHGRGMFRCRPLPIVFVDGAYVGVQDGTQFKPFDTIQKGLNVAGNGTSMSINKGTYVQPAPLVITRRMRVTSTNGNAYIR